MVVTPEGGDWAPDGAPHTQRWHAAGHLDSPTLRTQKHPTAQSATIDMG